MYTDNCPAKSNDSTKGTSQPVQSQKSADEKPASADKAYPKKVEINQDITSIERESIFPEPSFRKSEFEKDLWNSGVESPSDSRRPCEQPIPKSINKTVNSRETLGGQEVSWTPQVPGDQEVNPAKESYRPSATLSPPELPKESVKESSKEAAARETSFIEEFLADRPQLRKPTFSNGAKSEDWRQTVLDRRASQDFVATPRRKTDMPIVDVTARKTSTAEPTIAEDPTPELDGLKRIEKSKEWRKPLVWSHGPPQSSPRTRDERTIAQIKTKSIDSAQHHSEGTHPEILTSKSTNAKEGEDWLIGPGNITAQASNVLRKCDTTNPRRSTSDILDQLPKDDIDFLSAEEIRASMGSKKSAQENRFEARQRLEKDFMAVHEKDWQIDPMVESKIVNDQHVRRKERELLLAQEEGKAQQEADAPTMTFVEKEAEDAKLSVGTTKFAEEQLNTVNKEAEAKENIRGATAQALLEDEIDTQKAAMQGLSDDGYSRSPKAIPKKPFDEPNPLAHSLFRPFGLQLESLGKDVEAGMIEADQAARKRADKELVREVKEAYEDVYGPITVEHRQVPSDEEAPEKNGEEAQEGCRSKENEEVAEGKSRSIQLLKEDGVSPSVSESKASSDFISGDEVKRIHLGTPHSISGNSSDAATLQEPSTTASREEPAGIGAAASTASSEQPGFPDEASQNPCEVNEELSCSAKPVQVKQQYQILTYDAQTDDILITTPYTMYATASSSQADHPMPLHEALATLSHPSKFLPHIPTGFEIVDAKPHILVLRAAPAGSTPTEFHTARVPASPDPELKEEGWKGINPIDGTTRLSPTGYVGDGLELEREFQERRAAAGQYHGRFAGREREKGRRRERKGEEGKGKVGVGGVMKTAIIAAAWCYVAGVVAELMKYNG